MSRAAERKSAGVVRDGTGGGARGARGTRLPQNLHAITPGLMKRLARCQAWERDGIREYLRTNGSPKALDALARLERMWAAIDARDASLARPAPGPALANLIWLERWCVLALQRTGDT